jgi:hypothetical protein
MTTETAAEWIAAARNVQERGEALLPQLPAEQKQRALSVLAQLAAAIAEAEAHAGETTHKSDD